MFRRNLTTQLAVPALAVAVLGIVVIVVYAGANTRERVVDQLVANGIERLEEYRELRGYYTETVVAPARMAGMEVSAEHASGTNSIPLPATMIHELSDRLRNLGNGFRLALYSAHPFPERSERVLDGFAHAALQRFERDANGVFHELTEIEGQRYVRIAMADRMNAEACVTCHNNHPDTPRVGWQLGDVRGVLEVDLSAEEALSDAEALQHTLLAGGGLLCAALFVVVGLLMRRVSRRLGETVHLLDRVAAGDLDIEISTHDPDELGAMKTALEVAIRNMRGDMESLHRSHVVMDAAPVNLMLCDAEHRVQMVNPACRASIDRLAHVFGVEGAEVDGRCVGFLFDDPDEMRRLLDSDALPHRAMHTRGEERLDVTIAAIHALDGTRTGSLVTFSIVTEEHRNASLLQEAMQSERETGDRLRDAIERERERADADKEVATVLRLKADRILDVVGAAATGDLTPRIGLDGDSPMDQIAFELDRFLDDLSARVTQIRDIASQLGDAGHQLDDVGKSLVVGAKRTSEEVSAVARTWTATSEGVDGIETRMEGLAESFQGIASDSRAAARVVSSGVEAANTARDSISELDRSTEEIQIVLTVIDQIADQSKLLALNASIEAARAGESGRGFNVVAQEVKKLASQTEEATREIAKTVAQILARRDHSAESIRAMGEVMDRVESGQGLIGETVAAQQSATDEVKALVEQVGSRSRVIAASIEQLSQVAESAEQDAAGTDREAHRLFELANQIGELTSRFVC